MFVSSIKELFNIGNSTGSLISEIISLFKTFQMLSSTKSFQVHFSKDYLRVFSSFQVVILTIVLFSLIYHWRFNDIRNLIKKFIEKRHNI